MLFSTKQQIMGRLGVYLYVIMVQRLLTSFLQTIAFYFAGLIKQNVKKSNNYLIGMRLLLAGWWTRTKPLFSLAEIHRRRSNKKSRSCYGCRPSSIMKNIWACHLLWEDRKKHASIRLKSGFGQKCKDGRKSYFLKPGRKSWSRWWFNLFPHTWWVCFGFLWV